MKFWKKLTNKIKKIFSSEDASKTIGTKDIDDRLKDMQWEKNTWKRRAALVHKKGGRTSEYRGQKYDPEKIDLVEDGWSHDHCEICYQTLCESDDPKEGNGYSCGNIWICTECYEQHIKQKI